MVRKLARFVNALLAWFGIKIVRTRGPLARRADRRLLKAIARKWKDIDAAERHPDPNVVIACTLCHLSAPRKGFSRLQSTCIFMGGLLERFVCPRCGVIFGPLKVTRMTDEELNREYAEHYRVFREGDATELELRAFEHLKPNRSGTYLNIGSGAWSESLLRLRKGGWDIYGYEPHSAAEVASRHDFVITRLEDVKAMRFDGVMSNNTLEHFKDPIAAFRFFKTLLKDRGSRMVHSTPCYEYLHEHTRFHLHFFTGKSLDYLCRESGFAVEDRIEDRAKDFISVRFVQA